MSGDPFSPLLDEPPVEPLDPVMVADVLENLTVRQEALEHAFDTLARRLGATKDGPWTWRTLGPVRTRELFTELRDWVDWLTCRYHLTGEHHTIAPCWYRHPVAVEELTALMVAWRAAYSPDQAAPSDALTAWHDRCLWPTLHRLNTVLRIWAKCTAGTHTDPRPVDPPTAAGFTRYLDDLTRTQTPCHAGPLDGAHVTELLRRGEATALTPGDSASPITSAGRWYAPAPGPQPATWEAVTDDADAARLDELLHRRHSIAPTPPEETS